MPKLGFYYVVNKDGEEVDRVEYDPDAVSDAVIKVQEALGKTPEEALALVQEHNPDGALSNRENAKALADLIAARKVPDRDPSTYGPAGVLTVTETPPIRRTEGAVIVVTTPAADAASTDETAEESK